MDAAALTWLATEEGERLLRIAQAAPPDRLARISILRKLTTRHIASSAVELLELRARACGKFADNERMFLTPAGLEQSTGDRIAGYRASRFTFGESVLDACCGIGGDAIQLAKRGPVLAVDRDLVSATCTHLNAGSADPPNRIRTLCADVTALDLRRLYGTGIRNVFVDPSRRNAVSQGSARRTRDPEAYAPPLSWLERLREVFPFICVKASPAIDDDTLRKCACRVEFISDRGVCKEAVLWATEPPATPSRSQTGCDRDLYTATVLDASGSAFTLEPAACPPPDVAAPNSWVMEPDAAVVRAHLTGVLAAKHSLQLLDNGSYYLTGDSCVDTPFAGAYRLLDQLPLRHADVQKRCVALGRRVSAIKTRWSKIMPEELTRLIPGAAKGSPPVVIIVVQIRGRQMALLCEQATRE